MPAAASDEREGCAPCERAPAKRPLQGGRDTPRDYTSRMPRALIVDDAPEYRRLLTDLLESNGFKVSATPDGESAVELVRSEDPDVVLLDLGLPGIDGVEVCRRIRAFSGVYVVMLTGRDEEVDRLMGLTIGADDYVTKPFSSRELIARLHAMLRRPRGVASPGAPAEPIAIGDLFVDSSAQEVKVQGKPVDLTRIEFELLRLLCENSRMTLSRQTLLDRVWGDSWYGDQHVVDVHVSNLRKKLGDDPSEPRYVRTVRGFGYRLGAAGDEPDD